jgi:hypothetical protein
VGLRRPTKKEIAEWIVVGGTLGWFKSYSPAKKEIVDWIIAEATLGRFKGDKDGEAPPMTIQNFTNETIVRCAAKALRAHYSRLSRAELLTEASEAAAYVKAQREQIAQNNEPVELLNREAAERAHRQEQSTRAKRPRLQPAILAVARHYRGRGMAASEAWVALHKTPFQDR